MVLTPLPTQQSGIPPPSSVLASLGRQVHPPPNRYHQPPHKEPTFDKQEIRHSQEKWGGKHIDVTKIPTVE
ncbi:hypothetical protein BCEN4_840014 [Burkholderia cenocepacia]|nr:hypothetical protein BCEN4_840014 [Burkholderia cenocepacia]